jgi:hypothetical protein
MDSLHIFDVSGASPRLLDELRRELGAIRTLEHVLAWTRQSAPPRRVAEIVTQDEYTHDVVLPFAEFYLSFDTT